MEDDVVVVVNDGLGDELVAEVVVNDDVLVVNHELDDELVVNRS